MTLSDLSQKLLIVVKILTLCGIEISFIHLCSQAKSPEKIITQFSSPNIFCRVLMKTLIKDCLEISP